MCEDFGAEGLGYGDFPVMRSCDCAGLCAAADPDVDVWDRRSSEEQLSYHGM